MKILIVDDSKAMRMIVTRTLKATALAKSEFVEATNGREALDLILAGNRYDLVVSDWNMPEMTGIELLQALNERGIRVRFGFVTSESTPEMYERAMAHGAQFVVSKPFTPESFSFALSRVA